jgi:hypothetical protein
LRQVEGLGILRPIEPTVEGRYRWICDEVLAVIYNET